MNGPRSSLADLHCCNLSVHSFVVTRGPFLCLFCRHEELLMECGAALARGETDNNGVMFYISSDTPDEVAKQ